MALTLLRLTASNALVMLLQAVVSTLAPVFVGRLGADALAEVSLVFPPGMLMQTVSPGAGVRHVGVARDCTMRE